MEYDILPCGDPPKQGEPCNREVFERVWRRVMPEDRPDCPFTLEQEPPCPADLQTPAGQSALLTVPSSNPTANLEANSAGQTPAPAMAPAVSVSPSAAPLAQAPMASVQPSCEDNDVPCLGSASAMYGAQLQEYIDREIADWRAYQSMARRASGSGSRVLSTIAADERRHAKRLSTAYFLISGVRYWPAERITAPSFSHLPNMLRTHFAEEQRGEASYLASAAETADPCLRELYLELAGDENSHAWLLRGILEQM